MTEVPAASGRFARVNVSRLYRGRLYWVIGVRFAVAILVFFAIHLRVVPYQAGLTGHWHAYWPLLLFLAMAVPNLLYLMVLTLGWVDKYLIRFGILQALYDVLLASFVVYMTGGIHSWFTPLLFLPILTSGILTSGGFAVLSASLASIALATSAIVYQIYLQDYSHESAGWAVKLPNLEAPRWPDEESRQKGLAELRRLWLREFPEVIEPFTVAVTRTPGAPRSDLAAVKKEIDTILATSGWSDSAGSVDERGASQFVPVFDVELRKHNPPLADLVPWLIEFAEELPEAPAGVANTVISQVIAFYIVAFLVYAGTLRRREEILADALNRIRDGVLVLDRSYRVHFCNVAARSVLGLHPGAVIEGIRADRLDAGSGATELMAEIRAALAGSRPASFFWPEEGKTRDPKLPVIQVSIVQVEGRSRVEATVIWFKDVTERMRAIAAERLADRLRATGTMAAGLAHEIRNPLAAIRASAQELTTDDDSLAPELRERLTKLLISESDRLDAILADFLRFARQSKALRARVDLRELITESIELLPPRSPKQDIRILINVPPGLTVIGDRDQLKQVFLNLGKNALEAMPNGPGKLAFEAAPSMSRPRSVRVTVADSGVGMDPNAMREAGTPFFTTKPHGTGLGLAIAMRIVEEHGSEVVIESESGLGVSISFDLPA